MTPWTVAHQAPQSIGFSRQEYWSGLPFPSPGDLPDPGIEPGSPALEADSLTSEPLTYMFEQHFSLYLTCLLQIQFLSELQLWYFFFQYRSMKGKFRFHPVFISNFLLNAIKLGIEFYDIYFPLVR